MNKEKQEQLKIILLGIIAVVLIIQTGLRMSSKNDEDSDTAISTGPQGGQIPVTPGQTSVTVPFNAGQQSAQPATPGTTMVFEQKDVDLGTLAQGSKASHTYKVTNTGNQPLTFSNVQADAGASVISWPTQPIPIGGTGEIKIEFGSDNPAGSQQKIIHISANTEPPHEHLTITANVK